MKKKKKEKLKFRKIDGYPIGGGGKLVSKPKTRDVGWWVFLDFGSFENWKRRFSGVFSLSSYEKMFLSSLFLQSGREGETEEAAPSSFPNFV